MGPGSILLIWEEVGESIAVFWLSDLTQDQHDFICAAHDTYLNTESETHNTRFVEDLILDKDGCWRVEPLYVTETSGTIRPPWLPRVCHVVITGHNS